MIKESVQSLVDEQSRLVSREIFNDEEIYQEELERVFTRCWLFLGHESMLPEPGDYISNYMGEDPVIIWRDDNGKIRVFLNSCRHRGMKVCRADRGTAKQFTCPFHGWTYSNNGSLVGVPFYRDAYGPELKREKWGLVEVSNVSLYGGLIFAAWDPVVPTLDEYLGDLRWYFDILLTRPLGGLEFIPGQQRYKCIANWKLAAENFTGDTYHLRTSHSSVYELNIRQISPVIHASPKHMFSVSFDAGHGLTGIEYSGERYTTDIAIAKEMGSETVEYIEECHRRLAEKLSEEQAKVHSLSFGHVFPNFSHNSFSAFRPIGFYLWHPKGPRELEAWQWCAVDRDAPQAVKDMVRVDFTRTQAVAGIAAQDDTENFEQVTEATKGAVGKKLQFNYQMGMNRDYQKNMPDYPGNLSPYYSETNQLAFYRQWSRLMSEG